MSEAHGAVDVAVVGMAVRAPGAGDVATLWRNVAGGVSSVRSSADEALLAAGFTLAELADPAFVRAFGVLDDVDRFDAGFFGFSPAQAEILDPQQRLLLECAYEALVHAGLVADELDSVGAYLSLGRCSYRPLHGAGAADAMFAMTAEEKDYGATRVSYKRNLRGPCSLTPPTTALIAWAIKSILFRHFA